MSSARGEIGDARACPVCGAASMSKIGVLCGLPVQHCLECGHDCLATAGVDLSSFYQDHYSGFHEDPVFDGRVREVLKEAIAPRLPAEARVLDVGCGNGAFLMAARERGYHGLGIDFAQAAADACARRGLRAVAGDFLRHDFGADAPFDLVTLWDVCEHLERPLEFMARAHELLRPGGLLVLKVPCLTERAVRISVRVPRVAGALLGLPAHIQYFRPEGLRRLVQRAGFARADVLTLAPMRGSNVTRDPLKLAKRELLRALAWYSGNTSVLVRAQVAETGKETGSRD